MSQFHQPLGGESQANNVGLNEKSFTVVASGSGMNNGGGTDKGKAIILDGFPDFKEHSKLNANSKSLTINMGNMHSGCEKGETGMVNFTINLSLSCGPNGEWSI